MSLTAKILALYIAGLVFYPCVDAIHHHCMDEGEILAVADHKSQTEDHQHNNDEDEKKAHSPFCTCKNCHRHTTIDNPGIFVITFLISNIPLSDARNIFNFNSGLFHPPLV